MNITIPPSEPVDPTSDDKSDIGVRRQFKAMKARLQHLELLYSTRFAFQVPTSTSELQGPHGISCGFHPHVKVSMRTPRVECGVCGAALDPLDVLRQFVTRERQFAHTLEHLREEEARLRTSVDRMKKEYSYLRSQLKKTHKRVLQTTSAQGDDAPDALVPGDDPPPGADR